MQKPTREEFTKFVDDVKNLFADKMESKILSNLINTEKDITHEVKDAISKNIKNIFNSSIPALPDGCKFFYPYGETNIYVVEQRPTTRTISHCDYLWNPQKENASREHFMRSRISLPYVIFIIGITRGNFSWLRVYYRNKPLLNLSDELLKCNLPNVKEDTSGDICVGEMNTGGRNDYEIILNLIQSYWGSKFNADWTGRFFAMGQQDERLKNFKVWSENSKKDPLFVLKVDWGHATDVWSSVNRVMGKSQLPVPQINAKDIVNDYIQALMREIKLVVPNLENSEVASLLYKTFVKFYEAHIEEKKEISNDEVTVNRSRLVSMAEELIKYKLNQFEKSSW